MRSRLSRERRGSDNFVGLPASAIRAERERREALETTLKCAAARRRARWRIASAVTLSVVTIATAILLLVLGVLNGKWATIAEIIGWVGAIAGVVGAVAASVLALP